MAAFLRLVLARLALLVAASVPRRDGTLVPFNFWQDQPMTTPSPGPANLREVARTLYESTPLSLAEVAREVGLGERTLKRYSSQDGGWRKQASPGISSAPTRPPTGSPPRRLTWHPMRRPIRCRLRLPRLAKKSQWMNAPS